MGTNRNRVQEESESEEVSSPTSSGRGIPVLEIEVRSSAEIGLIRPEDEERKSHPIKSLDIYIGAYGDVIRELKSKYVPLRLFSEGCVDGSLFKFSSCCGYAIYGDVKKHYVKECTSIIDAILRANKKSNNGFGSVITTVTDVDIMKKLEQNGWKPIHQFLNYGSKHTVHTYQYTIE